MKKGTGKIYRYIGAFVMLSWMLAGFLGCGRTGESETEENETGEMEQDFQEPENDRTLEEVLSLSGGELRSIWMEDEELYAFVAAEDKEKPYRIYQVKDGSFLGENRYSDIMDQWIRTELKKAPASSYEYEARLGRNGVVYLLGRDKEGNVKRCFWMEEAFCTDILFYEKYEGRTISNIEISRTGKIYLESRYGGFMIPYDDFYGRIGLGLNNWEGRRTVLGEQRMYQFAEGWIYVWDIPSGASMEMIRCDVLTDGMTPAFIDKDDSIYLVGSSGVAYLPRDGSIWEILIDKDEAGFYSGTSGSKAIWVHEGEERHLMEVDAETGEWQFYSGTFELKQIWVHEEELYLMGKDAETGKWQILKQNLPGKAVKK